MTYMPRFNRRSFMVGATEAGAGFTLALSLPSESDAVYAAGGSPEVNAWVVIRPDETVVIRIMRSEMGQGSLTGLAQLVAEELDCDWSRVTTEFPTPGDNLVRNRVWGESNTTGSRAIRESNEYVRKGGATARMMLIQAAANAWNVPASECSATNGVITHQSSGRSVSYGKVANAAAKLTPPSDVVLKSTKDWKVAGKPLKRLDTPEKLVGKTTYGIDVRLPGMLYAAISACPVFGGTLKSYDETKAVGMPGVKHIMRVSDDAVAVVADSWWRAKTALEAVPVVWDEGTNAKVSSATIADFLKEGLDSDQTAVGNQTGDIQAALAGAAKVVEALYTFPYRIHATMEPMNATVLFTSDRCEVWAPTQNAEDSLRAAAQTAGLPLEKCDLHKTFVGGGFGRRGSPTDYVRRAVIVAKAIPGTPIKLLWSREEDTTHVSPDLAVPHASRARRPQPIDRAAYAYVRTIHPGDGQSGTHAKRQGPDRFPKSQSRRRGGGVRLQPAQFANRPRNAQSACTGGLLARRQQQPKRVLRRGLHGRGGACRRR